MNCLRQLRHVINQGQVYDRYNGFEKLGAICKKDYVLSFQHGMEKLVEKMLTALNYNILLSSLCFVDIIATSFN